MTFDISKLPPNALKLVAKIYKDCALSGVTINLIKEEHIDIDGTLLSGYFHPGSKEIAIATDVSWKEGLETLLHEYCHFLQWRKKTKIWKESDNNLFVEWVCREIKLSDARAKKFCRITQNLEMDCERRVHKLIKKYDLPIDIAGHIQWMNYTTWMYTMMLETRKWITEEFDWSTTVKKYVPSDRIITPKEWDHPPAKFREIYLRHN